MGPTHKNEYSRATTRYSRKLKDLLVGQPYTLAGRSIPDNLRINLICQHSGEAGPGTLFIAVKGVKNDGHSFLDQAIEAGADAIVVEKGVISIKDLERKGIVIVIVDDTRAILGRLASRLYQNPASEMTMIGITGTNGKTTVSYLMEQVLINAQIRVGVIGTVEYRYWSKTNELISRPAPFTTPDPLTLHGVLRDMADNGVTHVIMEVSSHALKQKRLGPIYYDLAIFTNLSQDHLDYHKTMTEYLAAKCLLFKKHMGFDSTVVVVEEDRDNDKNDSFPDQVIDLCRSLTLKTVSCGTSALADYRAEDSMSTISGVSFNCCDKNGTRHLIESRLVGSFNITNLLTAFGSLAVLGLDPANIAKFLGKATGAPGRIESVKLAEKPEGQPHVIVDYAHTPDALEKVLLALKDLAHDNLICVVGCGGNRDQAKRELMGRIAAQLADVIIVTDDNPRDEAPEQIRQAIISGVEQTGLKTQTVDWLGKRDQNEKGYLEIGDRATAIHRGVTSATSRDIVLIAGKGHEKYQINGSQRRFFDDVLAAQMSSLAWTPDSVAAASKGTVVNSKQKTALANVSTDTRTIGSNDIFVALTGDVFNGHDFVDTAIENGARCLIISEDKPRQDDICCVQVTDTLTALGDLAHYRRNQIKSLNNPIVVGLTGSCGKTTVKEMTAAIFSARWPDQIDKPADRVLKTTGNFNNLIGLPLSLLPVSAHHRGLVLEMGMNCPGEIARLTQIADPDICCITNVYKAHLEGLGSIEGVASAKGELFENSNQQATHVVNFDNEHVVRLSNQNKRNKTVGFAVTRQGLSHNPQVWAEKVETDENGHLSFVLHVEQQSRHIMVHTPGLHNAVNSCTAAAIGHAAGIDFDHIVEGLQAFRSTTHRMQHLISPSGLHVLNDSYNANPAAMASGLRTLADISARNRMAIIGDMLELGETSGELHQQIGTVAGQAQISYLALVGNFSKQIQQGALEAGMEASRIRIFTNKEKVVDWVGELMQNGRLQPTDWILVKASRGLALDTVVDQIMKQC